MGQKVFAVVRPGDIYLCYTQTDNVLPLKKKIYD